MGRLVRIRHESPALTRMVLPHDIPFAREAPPEIAGRAAPDSTATPERKPDGQPPRARHAARHARTSGPPAPQRTSLSIRSAERRRWSADLTRPDVTALVLHGQGGVGKSTLALQIAQRVSRLSPERGLTQLSGEVCASSLAGEPAEADLVVLLDFDANLTWQAGLRTVRDPALAALLATWTGKLLITAATAFTLPPERRDRFVFRHVGPLTRSGAAELALSLPALRLVAETQRDLAWRLTAGHPRAIEYLDSLLSLGVRFDDLAERVAAAVQARTGQSPITIEPTELSDSSAEAVALAAGQQLLGELFDRLSAGAQDLLIRASVYRTAVTPGVLAARPAHVAECQAAGLLTPAPGRELTVHRWTAGELHRRLAEAGRSAPLAAAHRQAAGYWHARSATSQLGARAQLEASYHLHQAGELATATTAAAYETTAPPLARPRHKARRLGLASAAGVAAVVLAVEATSTLTSSHLTSAERPSHPAAPAPLTQASTVRDQAATWVASQISAGAIVACDPVMCSALVRQGFPAANLLVLGPGTPDPLGSAVVLATSAVRAMFGSRLVTVYAPQTLASFGTGEARIDVRVVAPDGAAAYRTVLAADVRARRAAGLQLLADPGLTVPAPARADLAAGHVDARLLITLAALAANEPVRILAFGGDGPGASPGTPLRTAEIVAPPATAQAMLAFVRAQRAPYLPARSGLSGGPAGPTTLTIDFAAPTPLGLLQTPP